MHLYKNRWTYMDFMLFSIRLSGSRHYLNTENREKNWWTVMWSYILRFIQLDLKIRMTHSQVENMADGLHKSEGCPIPIWVGQLHAYYSCVHNRLFVISMLKLNILHHSFVFIAIHLRNLQKLYLFLFEWNGPKISNKTVSNYSKSSLCGLHGE